MNNDELVVYLPYIKDLVIASVPSIFAFILYRYQLAKDLKKENKKRELEILKERMEKFYNPFYVKYFKCEIPMTIDENKTKDLIELKNNLLKIHFFFIEYLYLMGENSQKVFLQLSDILIKISDISSTGNQTVLNNNELKILLHNFNNKYGELFNAIHNEYREICIKLGYPEPQSNFVDKRK